MTIFTKAKQEIARFNKENDNVKFKLSISKKNNEFTLTRYTGDMVAQDTHYDTLDNLWKINRDLNHFCEWEKEYNVNVY